MADFNAEFFFNGFLYLFNPVVRKFKDFTCTQVNKVIVLLEPERFFKLCTIISKLVFGNKVTIKQEFNGIIKGGTANPVIVGFHFNIKGLYIKMPFGCINLLQNGISFWSLPVAL